VTGIELWSISEQVRWCWDGLDVTSIVQYKVSNCCFPLWSFDGWQNTQWPPAGTAEVTSLIQAKFSFALSWFTGNVTPFVAITVRGNGSWTWTWG